MAEGKGRNNKARERLYLDCVRAWSTFIPDGPAVASEAPDFLLDLNGRRIGIEVTHFANRRLEREARRDQQDRLRTLVMRTARNRAQRWSCPPLLVTAFFEPHGILNRAAAVELARHLFVLASTHGRSSGALLSVTEFGKPHVPDGLAFVRVASGTTIPEHTWRGFSSVLQAEIAHEDVQAVINAKTQRYPRYCLQADDIWLIIIVDGFVAGCPPLIGHTVFAQRYQSPFAGVVLLDYLKGSCRLLTTDRAGGVALTGMAPGHGAAADGGRTVG